MDMLERVPARTSAKTSCATRLLPNRATPSRRPFTIRIASMTPTGALRSCMNSNGKPALARRRSTAPGDGRGLQANRRFAQRVPRSKWKPGTSASRRLSGVRRSGPGPCAAAGRQCIVAVMSRHFPFTISAMIAGLIPRIARPARSAASTEAEIFASSALTVRSIRRPSLVSTIRVPPPARTADSTSTARASTVSAGSGATKLPHGPRRE